MAVLRFEKLILRYPSPVFLKKQSGLKNIQKLDLRKTKESFSPSTLRTRLSDVPTTLYTKWLNRVSYQNSFREDYFDCLYFSFSDGQIFSLGNLPLVSSSYLGALPNGLRWPEIIQALRSAEEAQDPFIWMSAGILDSRSSARHSVRQLLKTDPSTLAFDSLMSMVIKHFLTKTFFRDLELGLSFSEDENDFYVPISRVETFDKPLYSTEGKRLNQSEERPVYEAQFSLCDDGGDLQTPFFSFQSETGLLRVRTKARQRWNELLNLFDKLEREGEEVENASSFNKIRFQTRSLAAMARMFEVRSSTLEFTRPQKEVRGLMKVNCSRDLKNFDVRMELPQEDGYLIHFGSLTAWMFKNAEEGLRTFMPDQGKFLVTPRRGRQRDEEMKLLRHQGAALLLIYECGLYILEKNQTTGEKINSDLDFQNYIFQRWQTILLNKTEKPVAPLWNKDLIRALTKLVSTMVETYRRPIPHFSKEDGNVDGAVKSCEAALTCAVIELALRLHGNSILIKQKTLSLKDFFVVSGDQELHWVQNFSATESPAECQLNEASHGWPLISFLKSYKFDIEFGGVPMAELTENDLRGVISIQSTPSEEESYFSLNPSVYFMGKKISPEEITFDGSGEFLKYRNEIYFVPKKNLPGVRSLMAFWQRLAVGKEKDVSAIEGKYVQLPRHGMLDVLAMANQGVELELDGESKKLLEYYRNLGKQSAAAQDIHSQIELKPYQLIGVQWVWDLYQMGLGGILSDEMGLGKTAQVLGFFELLKTRRPESSFPSLIIVPTSLLHNWNYESRRFFPDLNLQVLGSGKDIRAHLLESQKPQGIFVSTYGLMYEHREIFLNHRWNVIVFDEAHQLKNITAQRTGVARQLRARFKLAMTGTPLENNLIEFYSLFDLILPRGLGSLSNFRKLYVDEHSLYRAAQMEHLRLRSRPVLLRRTKESVHLELPDKIETLVPLEMEKRQKDLYRSVAMQFNTEILSVIDKEGEASAQLHMLSALMKLRQICSHPGVLKSVNYPNLPPKLEYLTTMLPDIVESGESVLIFTQFRKTMDLVLPHLKKIAPTFCLHGGMSSEERRRSLNDFSSLDKPSLLLMTLKTGGVGLNLTKASYVFHLEPWWNPAAEDQATDRAHRLGQTKTVNVYRLLMQDSLEERIQEMKARKQKMYSALLSEEYSEDLDVQSGQGLTKEDFSYLIGNLQENE